VRIVLSILCLVYVFFQPIDSLSQKLEKNWAAKPQLLLANLDVERHQGLLAKIETSSLKQSKNDAVKKSKKKVTSKKNISSKKKVASKKNISSKKKVASKKNISSKKKVTSKKNIKSKKKVSVKKKRKSSKNRMTKRQIYEEKRNKINMLNGQASWYGTYFHGRKTASGALYDKNMYTSAHRTLPLGTIVEIIQVESGNRAVVCITDRGPYIKGRAIDVSQKVAEQLNLLVKGVADVTLKVVGDKDGEVLSKDKAFYVSLNGSMDDENFVGPFTQFADASVMWEAINQVHAKSSIVIGKVKVN